MSIFEQIRRAELHAASRHFAAAERLLEIGGGSGLQARLIAAAGVRVMSIDLPSRLRHEPHFTVVDYDGKRIPARSGSFDCVFSSNVLEHVVDLPALFAEIRRVLKPDGVAVHVMPTPAWRFWTSAAHYPYVVKRLLGFPHAIPGVGHGPTAGDALRKRGLIGTLKRVLVAGPHGEYRSALAELYYFSERRWVRMFRENGFEVVKTAGTALFYTGYGLSQLPLGARARVARFLGSSTRIYVTRPR